MKHNTHNMHNTLNMQNYQRRNSSLPCHIGGLCKIKLIMLPAFMSSRVSTSGLMD